MTSDTTNGAEPTVLGQNLRAARIARELTQRDLAVHLGVYELAVSRWERGISVPNPDNLAGAADALGVTIAWLYTDDPEPISA